MCDYLDDNYCCKFTREYVYDKPVFDLYCGASAKCCWWKCPIYLRYKDY